MIPFTGIGFIVAIGVIAGLLFTPLAIAICKRFGFLDNPGRHKRHKTPVPILGGTALLVSVWTTLGIARLLYPELSEIDPFFPYIFAGALIIYGVGLLDDFIPQRAWVKLIAQIVAGLVLYWG
ncbi:MAG: hypothetical protein WAU88_09405, partial [Candidatus Zixiibacteriota bacterium]